MPRKLRRKAGVVELPSGVHRVVAGARNYFYYHPGRGTAHAGKRVRLPDDPTSPAFWAALREHQGTAGVPTISTFEAVADRYEASAHFAELGEGTRTIYRRSLKIARIAWGKAPLEHVRPKHVRAMLDELSETPGAANNMLGSLRAFSAWALERGHIDHSFTEAVKPYKVTGGHKPWTDAQVDAAHEHLTGMVRRGVMLMLYTGQRGSDMVRLGWTDIDDGGFRIQQQKTQREIYCPIADELAEEMGRWEKQPGPFVVQAGGYRYSRKQFSVHFNEARETIPALAGVTLHGLRATAVIRLRMAGLETAQIQDIIGMSMGMIERYARFADRKRSGKAAVLSMKKRNGL
jgi:integrase